jgi:Sulfotransferase domain
VEASVGTSQRQPRDGGREAHTNRQKPRDREREAERIAGLESEQIAGTMGGALPNLIVIGAQKCGTSGLHHYLGLHPEISMSSPKELNFFIEERNWDRGVEWYARHFDPEARVRGESSPNYTAYPHHAGVPERMRSLVPGARLVYLVRDPVKRIAAHWVHNYAKRREKGDIAATLMHPNTTYVLRSQYHMQLRQFLNRYPADRILVLDQDDLRNRRRETLREIFSFVGVDPSFEHPGFTRERHRTGRKHRATRTGLRLEELGQRVFGGKLPRGFWLAERVLFLRRPIDVPDVRDALGPEVITVLREDADRLRELTGRSFDTWSV